MYKPGSQKALQSFNKESSLDKRYIYDTPIQGKRNLTPSARVRSNKVILAQNGTYLCQTPQVLNLIPFVSCGNIQNGFIFPIKQRLRSKHFGNSNIRELTPTKRISVTVAKEYSPEARTESTTANS